jgi:site-specific DNA recombinase
VSVEPAAGETVRLDQGARSPADAGRIPWRFLASHGARPTVSGQADHPRSRLPAALSARVSSAPQTAAHPMASQGAARQERATAEGGVVSEARPLLEAGSRGAALVRPAVERLRDALRAGLVDRLSGHAPARLARTAADQGVLLEALRRLGVAGVVVNRARGHRPDAAVRWPVHGRRAAEDRAQMLARHRRGTRQAARAGAVNVLGGAPSGSRSSNQHPGGGQARDDVSAAAAWVVRQGGEWRGCQRLAMGAVCRRLRPAGDRPRPGRPVWDRRGVGERRNQPADRGRAACGKPRPGPRRPRRRAPRGQPWPPRQATTPSDVPRAHGPPIAVPALGAREVCAAGQAQRQDNRRPARPSRRGARYVRQGLLQGPPGGSALATR